MASTSHAALEGFAGAVAATTALAATYPLITVRIVGFLTVRFSTRGHRRKVARSKETRVVGKASRARGVQGHPTERRPGRRKDGNRRWRRACNLDECEGNPNTTDGVERNRQRMRDGSKPPRDGPTSGPHESKPQGNTSSTESVPTRDCRLHSSAQPFHKGCTLHSMRWRGNKQ